MIRGSIFRVNKDYSFSFVSSLIFHILVKKLMALSMSHLYQSLFQFVKLPLFFYMESPLQVSDLARVSL